MQLMKSKKGAAFTWIAALMMIFFIAIIYIVMTEPFEVVYDEMRGRVDADHQTVFDQIRSVWGLWPLILIIGILAWAVLRSMRRDPNEYYYG